MYDSLYFISNTSFLFFIECFQETDYQHDIADSLWQHQHPQYPYLPCQDRYRHIEQEGKQDIEPDFREGFFFVAVKLIKITDIGSDHDKRDITDNAHGHIGTVSKPAILW